MGLPTRDALRATTPPTYRWTRHVALIVAFAAAGLAVCLYALGGLGGADTLVIGVAFLLTNLGEYVAHRWPLHRPMFPRAVYERHVREHHAFFTYDRMAVDAWPEIRWVLFPPWALPLLVATVVPLALLVGAVAGTRAAWLFVLVAIAYYALYEVLHALAHLPDDAPLARVGAVRALTHHHRVHHDPALMRSWNFNFAIPLFDVLLHTRYAGVPPEADRVR
ncbi:MAG: sterol desaturase family protein [Deltaproteobacteria bacterium]|nr:sterol desaturase family protein [Deltaproteobacteria bacterium]